MKSSQTLSSSLSHAFMFTVPSYQTDPQNFLSSLFVMLFSQASQDIKGKLIHLINKQIQKIRQYTIPSTDLESSNILLRKSGVGILRHSSADLNSRVAVLANLRLALDKILEAPSFQNFFQQNMYEKKIYEGMMSLFKLENYRKETKKDTFYVIDALCRFFQMKTERIQYFSFEVIEFEKINSSFLKEDPLIYEVQIDKKISKAFFSKKFKKLKLQGKNLSLLFEEGLEKSIDDFIREESSFFHDNQNGDFNESEFLQESQIINGGTETHSMGDEGSIICEQNAKSVEQSESDAHSLHYEIDLEEEKKEEKIQMEKEQEKEQEIKNQNSEYEQILMKFNRLLSDDTAIKKNKNSQTPTKDISFSVKIDERKKKKVRRRSLQLKNNELPAFEDSYPTFQPRKNENFLDCLYTLKGISGDKKITKHPLFQWLQNK